jgi:hypothetical protein
MGLLRRTVAVVFDEDFDEEVGMKRILKRDPSLLVFYFRC